MGSKYQKDIYFDFVNKIIAPNRQLSYDSESQTWPNNSLHASNARPNCKLVSVL